MTEVVVDNVSVVGKELVDAMNEHFVSTGVYSGKNSGADIVMSAGQIDSIMLTSTTTTNIEAIIMALENNAAVGEDEIKALPVKYVAHLISPVLTHIINETFAHDEFPDELKIAKDSPVYKEGGEQELNNYRLISVLPLFSKMFQRIINDRLTSFFEKHEIITKSQYVFQKDKSAEQALIKIKDKIIENIENY